MEIRTNDETTNVKTNDNKFELTKLSKRLAYLLRYGARKEGLDVDDNGYVHLDDLLKTNLMLDYSREDVLDSVKTSVSYRKVKRYDLRETDGKIYIRAAYLRNFEKNPCHTGCNVHTLLETSMNYIISNLDYYDLQDFPDENIIRDMIRRLKRQKKLSNKALMTLLVPTVTRLDLEGVYLTKNTLRMIWTQCPNLVAVSLKDCGYIITDSVLNQFTTNLPKLERLNLCSCNHLTAKCLSILNKTLKHLKVLHIATVPSLTYKAVLDFILAGTELNFLDVYFLKTTETEYKTLTKLAQDRGLNLILREPKGHNSEKDDLEEVEEPDEDCDEFD
ncbi:uncharacterized protein LOC131955735 [Physella acuta]|uniref:uncharacterized protein LOC131955735 n=1 Tax=Physella acuta TaxID=109671 RepID=UPI0027DE9E32|nr:uncharacterized protein LOC131955735 [Physella acuta]XP_059175947.1 uncharacterized protein LOC131955735 [Physella acuta]